MNLSPSLSRLSGVILSGMLLAGNVLVPSTSQTLPVNTLSMPAALTDYSKSTIDPQFLHPQLQLAINDPEVIEATKEANQSQTNNEQSVKNSPNSSSQAVHTAQTASAKTQPKEQVSRGNDDSSDIIDHAVSLVGTPYVFGGTSRKGFDCSGFTQYIYAGSGVSLPRTSYAQYASGVSISKNELQPGDLVFFSTYSKGASHVGIYIGGGRFVHADNPRVGVTITNLSNSFYTEHYLGARRYA
ncbi:C40 family peptidase [Desulfosporosinus sp. SB140]|uniref:C40 family peptidase n=1 Tax=Desulfosporosinus paludis TaxID=3115649 RepID=UPI00388EE8C6